MPRLVRTKKTFQHWIVLRGAGVNVVSPELCFVIARGHAADVAIGDINVQAAIVVEIACSHTPRPASAGDLITHRGLREAPVALKIKAVAVTHLRAHPLVACKFRPPKV